MLGEWAELSLKGDAEKSRVLLRKAEEIGFMLRAKNGDELLISSVGVIRRAQSQKDRFKLSKLQHGHAAFKRVRGAAIYSECGGGLDDAEAALDSAGSPFVGWVRLDQAVCAYFYRDFSHAERILLNLQKVRGGLALQGRAAWILGLIRMVQGRFVEAERHYSDAIKLFSRLGEEAHVVYLRSLRAKSYEYGGARQRAWQERIAALAARPAVGDPERLFTIFEEAAQALQSQGYPVAALSFLSEQMWAAETAARQTGETDLLAYTLLDRAVLLMDIGRRAEAKSDIDRAWDIWINLAPNDESRRRLQVKIELQRSMFQAGAELEGPLAAADRALDYFAGSHNSLGDQVELLKVFQIRAKLQLQLGNFRGAKADLLRGVEEIERQRLEVATTEDRARFLAQARSLFLDLIRLELDEYHDPISALAALERSGNQVLADSARGVKQGAVAPGLRKESLVSSLPAGSLLVRYGRLPDRLLVWTIFDGNVDLEQRLLSEADLLRQVQRCRDLVIRGSRLEESEAACNTLAQTILPRRLADLPSGSSIILIPDEATTAVPFAALRAKPGKPFLVERFRLSYAPDLSTWLRGTVARPRNTAMRAALFVSDPAFSPKLFPGLARLTAARRSVASFASHYSAPEILSDRDATVPALLSILDRFEVLHFDGHGITNPQYPERGGLLLAPVDPEAPDLTSSLLTAADLPPRSLRRLRLVILGACSTGLTRYEDTAEVTGLAAAFLARGVPEVIAVAWDVPDEASALLLEHFHRELAAGKSVEESLQAAQIRLLRSEALDSKRTNVWGAFQLFRNGH